MGTLYKKLIHYKARSEVILMNRGNISIHPSIHLPWTFAHPRSCAWFAVAKSRTPPARPRASWTGRPECLCRPETGGCGSCRPRWSPRRRSSFQIQTYCCCCFGCSWSATESALSELRASFATLWAPFGWKTAWAFAAVFCPLTSEFEISCHHFAEGPP